MNNEKYVGTLPALSIDVLTWIFQEGRRMVNKVAISYQIRVKPSFICLVQWTIFYPSIKIAIVHCHITTFCVYLVDSGGIRGEDAGEYSCFSLGDADHKAKMIVNVDGKRNINNQPFHLKTVSARTPLEVETSPLLAKDPANT